MQLDKHQSTNGEDFSEPELHLPPDPPQPENDDDVPRSLLSTNERNPKKRNSGRSGPTSAAGVARSAMNSLKHGACSKTLILACESEAAWLLLLDRWCQHYNIPSDADDDPTQNHDPENTLLYDFVLKTAQAEWFRIRCQRNYDVYYLTLNSRSPFNWSPEEIKMHDLLLRYKNTADRGFHREHRALEQYVKSTAPKPNPNPQAAQPEQQPPQLKPFTLVGADPKSPTGYRILKHIENGREVVEMRGQPYTPPDPIPSTWPKCFPEGADKKG